MEVKEKKPLMLMRDRSMLTHCPRIRYRALNSYSTTPEEIVSGVLPSHVVEKNVFREHPCSYCTKMRRQLEFGEGIIMNSFDCLSYGGKVCEVGVIKDVE